MILNNFKCGVAGAFLVFAAGVFAGRFTAPYPGPTRSQVVSAPTEDEQSPKLRAKVEMARQRQTVRFAGNDIAHNAAIPGGAVMEYCQLSPQAMDHYKKVSDTNVLTTRSMDRLAKVARTVADLAEHDTVEPEHIDSACRFVIGGMLRENF